MALSEHQLKTLEIIARVTPNIIVRKYKDDCCIAASRIIIEVLKKLHFRDVRPFSVEANVFNEVYVKKGRTPQSDEEAQAWLAEGAWQVVVGDKKEIHEGRWPGHLAVLLQDQYLLDVAIFQATRPHKNISLSPIFTSVPEDFVRGEDKCGLMFNNCLVVYVPYPNDKSYETARDWWDVGRCKDVVSDILAEVKVILGKKK
jgi:hypothetical protein